MSVIKKETIDVRRVDTALIGGDFSGNARGSLAIDIQMTHTLATDVASGANSLAIGQNNRAADDGSVAIGKGNESHTFGSTVTIGGNNEASGDSSIAVGINCEGSATQTAAIGYACTASGLRSAAIGNLCNATQSYAVGIGRSCDATATYTSAIGYDSDASTTKATAIGYKAKARIEATTNICGPIIIRKDNGEAAADAFFSFCGAEVILTSKEVDLKAVADQTITLPANCKFWLNEIGTIATDIADLVAQPTVRYGITGNLAKHNAAAITTALTAAGKREIETPLVPEDGETSLTAGVTIAADATTFNGKFYWKGMLIEDE